MKNIYKYIYKCMAVAVLGITTFTTATAQNVVNGSVVNDKEACGMNVVKASMKRSADLMSVDMNLNLEDFDLSGNRVAVFAPVLVNGDKSLELQPVGLYSRTRWYQYLRAGEKPLGGENEQSIRYSNRPDVMNYRQVVDYADWMNGAQLYLKRCDYGCCRTLINEQMEPLMGYAELKYVPAFRYVHPKADNVKARELSGRAFVDFPVNLTTIYPDYRDNTAELRKIIATIDSVRNDKDVTVSALSIKGFASPEGPYDNNIRLAKGRTAALKEYVRKLYNFDDNFIKTSYEPEDWEGLRNYVAGSVLEHRKEILDIIDGNLAPDPKNAKIQSTYPEEYKFLLKTVYPALRHSDYTIEYTIRSYTDINEIREIMATAPQKLSLNEMFLLAQTYTPGSAEYNNIFDVAVRMYPNDETANLNAANAAMGRSDYASAAKYLEKAGQSEDAIYTRGVLNALQGNYTAAAQLFSKAPSIPEAAEALATIKAISE